MSIRVRDSVNNKGRASRPMNLEQLEARMMCTINDLQHGLNLLANPLSAPTVGAVTNTAPRVSRPVTATGLASGVVTGKSVTLSALGADDKGESRLSYSWAVAQAPTGAQVTFSANGNNAAKRSTLTFNKAGNYSIQLKITDRQGASVTRLQNITVAQKLTSLAVQQGGTTLKSGATFTISGAECNLSATAIDQFGMAMSAQPNFMWTTTKVASGGKVTVSTVNSSAGNTAKLRFEKAGNYVFEVTTGKLKSRVTAQVVQSLSSISVTPGTAELQLGAKQQFSATGLDQFGLPMATQPKFTWTSSGGAISTTGLFTAPQSAGTYSVAVQTGSLSARATIKINATSPAPASAVNEITNVAIKNLTQSYFADGSITRTEMIQLLRSAGIDGSVDSTELTDLRYIVANASKFNIPAYVQDLASDVVNSNPANSLYQGTALGNLSAGSSAAQLNKLIDKWFLGIDRPTLTNSSLSYKAATGTLFVGLPTYTDQRQGMLGDCYFIAALGSLATSNPTAIQNMFIDNGDGTYTIRFYGGTYGAYYNADGSISEGFSSGVGIADYVTVDRFLPAASNNTFAYSNYGLSLSSPTNALWIALAEKAYAQWNATGKSGRSGVNSYASIEGGWMSYVDAQVLGYNATRYALAAASSQKVLIDAINANLAVTTGTRGSGLTNGLVGSHAYMVSGYNPNNATFTLYNPWGTTQPTPLTWAQMQANLTQFVVANGSRTTPILMTASSTTNIRSQVELPIMQTTPLNFVNPHALSEAFCQNDDTPDSLSPTSTIELDIDAVGVEVADLNPGDKQFVDTDSPTAKVVDILFDIDQLDALFEELLS